jgi:hypothetical protein
MILPFITLTSTLVLVVGAVVVMHQRLREGHVRWPAVAWIALVLGGGVGALVSRIEQTLVVDIALGRARIDFEGVQRALVSFGISGPIAVLTIAAAVWGALVVAKLKAPIDPALAAAIAGSAFAIVRRILAITLDHDPVRTGLRSALAVLDDAAIAGFIGTGLALSSLDGSLGGTPFGRYSITAMILFGLVDASSRMPESWRVAIAIGIAGLLLVVDGINVTRIVRNANRESFTRFGREALATLAKQELARGYPRVFWFLVFGPLGYIGGMALAIVSVALLGHAAHVDFGEIDRTGPGAEYASMLLGLGVVMSFPVMGVILSAASGGREQRQHAYMLEALIAAAIASSFALWALGAIAPSGISLGLAIMPITVGLAAAGAWITTGRAG